MKHDADRQADHKGNDDAQGLHVASPARGDIPAPAPVRALWRRLDEPTWRRRWGNSGTDRCNRSPHNSGRLRGLRNPPLAWRARSPYKVVRTLAVLPG